jgi:two-component system, chemotaxis family, protein-glutamate methylesterase/glutaminase
LRHGPIWNPPQPGLPRGGIGISLDRCVHRMGSKVSVAVVMAGSAGSLQVMFDQVRSLVQPDSSCLFLLYHRGEGPASDWNRLLPKRSGFVAKPMEVGRPVEPRTIYYPSSGITYGVRDGTIKAVGDLRPRPNLDATLQTLAAEYGERLVAILLSGWGTDGVQGMKAVRHSGGMSIIQDPATAEVGHLPRRALLEGAAQHIMDPDTIVQEVEKVMRGVYGSKGNVKRAVKKRGTAKKAARSGKTKGSRDGPTRPRPKQASATTKSPRP